VARLGRHRDLVGSDTTFGPSECTAQARIEMYNNEIFLYCRVCGWFDRNGRSIEFPRFHLRS